MTAKTLQMFQREDHFASFLVSLAMRLREL